MLFFSARKTLRNTLCGKNFTNVTKVLRVGLGEGLRLAFRAKHTGTCIEGEKHCFPGPQIPLVGEGGSGDKFNADGEEENVRGEGIPPEGWCDPEVKEPPPGVLKSMALEWVDFAAPAKEILKD